MNLNLYVTYFPSTATYEQTQAIESFLAEQHAPFKILATFTENTPNKSQYKWETLKPSIAYNFRNNKWPALKQAIASCQEQGATLLIAELGTLTSKEIFVNSLLNANIKFYCFDQPFVDREILAALHKHAKIQKQLHGSLIKEGLKHTSARSGNPNAAEVISKVNKPKIDAAIVFAFLLQPIVNHYKQQGFSQRQMVKSLNEEGFTAPEGGKWVLSQLQKVLERVKINEIVMQTMAIIEPLLHKNYSVEQIAEELNNQQVPSLKKATWDLAQVNKILFRAEQIKDIENINKFVINLLPVLHNFKAKNYSAKEILQCFEKQEILIQA